MKKSSRTALVALIEETPPYPVVADAFIAVEARHPDGAGKGRAQLKLQIPLWPFSFGAQFDVAVLVRTWPSLIAMDTFDSSLGVLTVRIYRQSAIVLR
jgi:hypothetical protein